MSWIMETGTLTDTFQQLDTVLFPLILANMFHCCIPKIPNNKVYKYSYNVHCLIDTHLHLISTSLDILGLEILGLDILGMIRFCITSFAPRNFPPELRHQQSCDRILHCDWSRTPQCGATNCCNGSYQTPSLSCGTGCGHARLAK